MKKALVVKSTGNIYKIKIEETNEILEARLLGKLRLKDIKNTNPLVVGDYIRFSYDKDNRVIIEDILPRKNYIIRKSVNLSRQNHIIASNIDQCILVCTILHPEISFVFIDRFLVISEAFNIETVIVFNKIDLLDKEADREYLDYSNKLYSNVGYKTLEVSCDKKEGIEELKELLKDKKSLISGNSGVGKSTIINTLNPNFSLKTQKISDYYKKGRHTTTFSELFEWDFGGYIIDTPGVKSFGIIDDIGKEEVKDYFREFFKKSNLCKYYNCTHTREPNCAIIEAMKKGEISKTRYNSYLSILEEIGQR